ncbi:hypothetical protein D3C87_1984580 [compost metagenome]
MEESLPNEQYRPLRKAVVWELRAIVVALGFSFCYWRQQFVRSNNAQTNRQDVVDKERVRGKSLRIYLEFQISDPRKSKVHCC